MRLKGLRMGDALSRFVAILAYNAIRPRSRWRYLCPLAGFPGLLANVAQIRHNVDAKTCKPCQLCLANCATGAVEYCAP